MWHLARSCGLGCLALACSAGQSGALRPGPGNPASAGSERPARLERVLVFTRTTGYRHQAIEPGVEALRRLGERHGFAVERSEEPADFRDDRLAGHDVVVWLNT